MGAKIIQWFILFNIAFLVVVSIAWHRYIRTRYRIIQQMLEEIAQAYQPIPLTYSLMPVTLISKNLYDQTQSTYVLAHRV